MRYAMLIMTALCLVGADSEPDTPVKTDKELLQGKWKVVACQDEGKKSKLTDEELQLVKLIVKDDHYVVELPPGDVFGSNVVTRQKFKFALDESRKPKTIDITMLDEQEGNKKRLGITHSKGAAYESALARMARQGQPISSPSRSLTVCWSFMSAVFAAGLGRGGAGGPRRPEAGG
jgi:uncharacterized protein (TIGR03067 family)